MKTITSALAASFVLSSFSASAGLIKPETGDKKFYLYGEPGKATGLYLYRGDTPTTDVREQYPEKFEEMNRLMQGLYQTAKYMLYHNPSRMKAKVSASGN